MKKATVEQAKVLKEYKALEKQLGRTPNITDFENYKDRHARLYLKLEGLKRKKMIK